MTEQERIAALESEIATQAHAAMRAQERVAALTLAEPLDRLYEWAKRTIRADLHSPLEIMGEYESLREERDRMAQIIYDTQDLYRHFPVLSGWGRDPGKPEHLVSQITNILNLYSDSCRTLALIAKERDELAAEWGTEGCPSPVVRGKQILAAVKARAKAEGRAEGFREASRRLRYSANEQDHDPTRNDYYSPCEQISGALNSEADELDGLASQSEGGAVR